MGQSIVTGFDCLDAEQALAIAKQDRASGSNSIPPIGVSEYANDLIGPTETPENRCFGAPTQPAIPYRALNSVSCLLLQKGAAIAGRHQSNSLADFADGKNAYEDTILRAA